VDLIWISGVERHDSREMRVAGDHPPPVIKLLLKNVAKKAPSGSVAVLFGRLELFRRDRRDIWERIDLPMGMMEGHSYSIPLVLEYEDIIYVIDRSELAISVCPYFNKVCDVVNIEVCKCGVMFVCVEDYFANALCGLDSEDAGAFHCRFRRNMPERRELVFKNHNLVAIIRHFRWK